MKVFLLLVLVGLCGADFSDHCLGQVFSCKSCRSTMICRKEGSTWKDMGVYVDCPAETPYCSAASGTCSATPDSDCGHDDPAFLCLGNGRYPDPSNCTNYHDCDDKLVPSQFPCAEGRQYDPDSQDCQPITSIKDSCTLPSCGGQKGIKVPIGDSHYYAYCDQTGVARVVDRCEGDYRLNQTSQQCEAICDREGVLADNNDCTKYWRCDRIWLKPNVGLWLRRGLSCPQGQGYSRQQFMCVSIDQVPQCQGPAPPTGRPTHPPSSSTPETTTVTEVTDNSNPTEMTTAAFLVKNNPKKGLSRFFGWAASPNRLGHL